MTILSVNINKFALIRNARGINQPDLIDMCERCIEYGAQGITVHPRPDERHVKFSDLSLLSQTIQKRNNKIEFNIEGFPSEKFCNTVNKIIPDQVTLVPDPPSAITSSFGWNCLENKKLLSDVVGNFKSNNIRVSLFINPSKSTLENLSDIGVDRVELYTFDYAKNYETNHEKSILPYKDVVEFLKTMPSIGINAGHDLNLDNLGYFLNQIQVIKEVSIGHAIVCDAFKFGLKNTINRYLSITKQ